MNSKDIQICMEKIAKKLLKKDYKKIGGKISVKRNENLDFGDYSSNILFLISKIKKISQQEAFNIIEPFIKKIKFVKQAIFINGFLNFFLDEKVFINDFKKIIKGKNIFCSRKSIFNRRKQIIIDYVSANPTGPLQLGNARGAIIGNCIAKILKLRGIKTISEYFVNDRGVQIDVLGKSAIYCLKKLNEENVGLKNFELEEDNFYRGDYLQKIVFERKNEIQRFKDSDFQKIGEFVAYIILNDYIKTSLRNFGIEFNNYFYETSLYNKNLNNKVLKILDKKGFIEKRAGAVWILLTKIGEAKNEVIIKSSGDYTYFWSDILYHYHKFFIRKSSSLLIVSADHLDHIRRLKNTFEKIFKIRNDKFKYIVYQMAHLIKGDELVKMSKRRGDYITIDDLVKEVGLDPVKFFFLGYSFNTTVEFDLELAKKQSEENPIWYLHYGYARLIKILEKSKNFQNYQRINSNVIEKINTANLIKVRQIPNGLEKHLNNSNYKNLFRKIHQFSDIISEISEDLRTNLLPKYLSELAKMIHNFYEKERVIGTENEEEKLFFIIYIIKILEIGFYLIGVEPKEEL